MKSVWHVLILCMELTPAVEIRPASKLALRADQALGGGGTGGRWNVCGAAIIVTGGCEVAGGRIGATKACAMAGAELQPVMAAHVAGE
jgi:hypothetical protein